MPNEPFWLPPEEIIDLNRDLVAETGEPFLLRDRGLLESACARPVNLWAYEHEDDVLVLAVSLLLRVAQNHVFMQGNKRTAFLGALMMLRQNGWRLDRQLDSKALADLIVSALREDIGEHTLVDFLRPCLHRAGV